jgi:hypothetical protein
MRPSESLSKADSTASSSAGVKPEAR